MRGDNMRDGLLVFFAIALVISFLSSESVVNRCNNTLIKFVMESENGSSNR